MSRRRTRRTRTFPHTHETQRSIFKLTPEDLTDGFREGSHQAG